MLGAIMFVSKLLMSFLPNIHLIGMLTMTYTIVFKKKALIPIYIFVILDGIYSGFSIWWIPYLYIWTVLWIITMLLPKNMSDNVKYIVYPIVCAIYGLLFGTLYAPAQALMTGMSFDAMIAWIITGLPYDVIHAVSNFFVGLLIMPLSKLIKRLIKYKGHDM